MNIWSALWHSQNRTDGIIEHLLYKDGVPVLFRTKREANEWIRREYGYIAVRKDLRQEPHGWRMPKPVRVKLEAVPPAK